jgi:hypothetical protein
MKPAAPVTRIFMSFPRWGIRRRPPTKVADRLGQNG